MMTTDERETLEGLLKLCEKMFNSAVRSAELGFTTIRPTGVKFRDLKFVQRADALLLAGTANENDLAEDTAPEAK